MSMHDKIEARLTGHPLIETTMNSLDRSIVRYLPASPFGLRQKIDQHPANGFAPGHYRNLITLSECLLVLTELDDRQLDHEED